MHLGKITYRKAFYYLRIHSCLEIGYKIANDTIYLISYPSSSINNSRKKTNLSIHLFPAY